MTDYTHLRTEAWKRVSDLGYHISPDKWKDLLDVYENPREYINRLAYELDITPPVAFFNPSEKIFTKWSVPMMKVKLLEMLGLKIYNWVEEGEARESTSDLFKIMYPEKAEWVRAYNFFNQPEDIVFAEVLPVIHTEWTTVQKTFRMYTAGLDVLGASPFWRYIVEPPKGQAYVTLDFKSMLPFTIAALSEDDMMLHDLNQGIYEHWMNEYSLPKTVVKPMFLKWINGAGAKSMYTYMDQVEFFRTDEELLSLELWDREYSPMELKNRRQGIVDSIMEEWDNRYKITKTWLHDSATKVLESHTFNGVKTFKYRRNNMLGALNIAYQYSEPNLLTAILLQLDNVVHTLHDSLTIVCAINDIDKNVEDVRELVDKECMNLLGLEVPLEIEHVRIAGDTTMRDSKNPVFYEMMSNVS